MRIRVIRQIVVHLLGHPERPFASPLGRSADPTARRTVGHFEAHVREAIALNRERAPRYAALSGGASRSISRALIAAELLTVPVARWFDRRAAPYQRAGVPLFESLFMPMSATPPFVAVRHAGVPESDQRPAKPAAIRRRVTAAHRAGSFQGAADALAIELAALAAAPGVDCMVRHLLESAHRLAQLAPDHVAAAQERGLPSPGRLLARLLRLHLWALGPAGLLDRRARPLQARGIAILAQDLPPIPPAYSRPR